MEAEEKPRRRLSTEERREELIKLGFELFDSHAYEDLSIDAIAKAAGISKGLLYHYFPSKRAFYIDVVKAAAATLLDETLTPEGPPPIDRVATSIDAFIDFVVRGPRAFAFLMRRTRAGDASVTAVIDTVRAQFAERLAEQGAPPAAAAGLIAFFETAVLSWVESGEEGAPPTDRQALRDLLLRVSIAALT
ncbi:MAG: TetR/AcrR family transcriptional regulator [Myxococcota bacterium]